MTFLKIIKESTLQALQQLWGNRLRTFLSLLGITIGIWCVIIVLSAVDSMESNIRQSFEKLGDDVIYVEKFSWMENPSADYWKWMRRPYPSYKDYKAIKKNVSTAQLVAYSLFEGSEKVEFGSSHLEGAFSIAVTQDYARLFNLNFDKGRFFTETEYHTGGNQIILGYKVAKELFGENIEPIGKRVKFMGRKCYVIGVIEESGNDIINPLNFDNCVIFSYPMARKVTNVSSKNKRSSINIKAKEGVSLEELKDDATGVLRAIRRLQPKAEDNFALNTLSILSGMMDNVFGALRMVGIVIGVFSMIVGMFSVANIMFVSVRERTSIIGVKKALGAKNFMILLEFLIESVILCLIGGSLGLLFVWLASYAISTWLGFAVFLSAKNVFIGIITSTLTGIISGIIPALLAARMNPVEAIRS